MAKVAPPEALGHMQVVAGRVTGVVKPGLAIETGGVDDQRIAVPAATRVSQPGWIGILAQLAAVEEDLAIEIKRLIQDHHYVGFLLVDLEGIGSGVNSGKPRGQTVGLGFVAGVDSGASLLGERLRPRLDRE